jgi:Holliday junction resolvasome RuvABC ATP-dependent DNA helicase subunit
MLCIKQRTFRVFPDQDIINYLDCKNPQSPYHFYVGNEKAVKRLSRSAFVALTRKNHSCTDQYFALIGPASTGKTTLAKIQAKILGLPFVEIQPQAAKNVQSIYDAMLLACGISSEENDVQFPPMIVFIDEIHALKNKVVQGLLKATEHNDCQLVTENNCYGDTSNVCWMIATTERGLLFDAFDTRFEKINLSLYSKKEIAKIIKNNLNLCDEACDLIAYYNGNIPREALSFAREVVLVKRMASCGWKEAIETVAKEREIDQFGMSLQRVKILTALGQKPIPSNQLAVIAGCKIEELRKFIMPPLVSCNQDQLEPLVAIASGVGYYLTNMGKQELIKRKITFSENSVPKFMSD